MPHRIVRILLASTLAAAGGCGAGGAVLYKAFGPPAVSAQYEPKRVPTLVLVEDFADQDGSAVDGDRVARQVGEALHDHARLTVIDPDKLAPVRAESAAGFRGMSIPAIGRRCGADQVVYVNLTQNQTTADPTGAAVTALATARVRVIDCATGEVVWPLAMPQGYELSAKVPYDRSDSTQGLAMRGQLLNRLSDEISHLFYDWKPDSEQPDVPGT